MKVPLQVEGFSCERCAESKLTEIEDNACLLVLLSRPEATRERRGTGASHLGRYCGHTAESSAARTPTDREKWSELGQFGHRLDNESKIRVQWVGDVSRMAGLFCALLSSQIILWKRIWLCFEERGRLLGRRAGVGGVKDDRDITGDGASCTAPLKSTTTGQGSLIHFSFLADVSIGNDVLTAPNASSASFRDDRPAATQLSC